MSRPVTYLFLLAFLMPLAGIAQQQDRAISAAGREAAGYISIGLLLPDLHHTDLITAAELAINNANAAIAGNNKRFRLVTRSTEGFWGAGSKESVSLVYEDQVCAIIGSVDGRNGHLAEQVAAKSQLTYIEAYATEPTLSQAFVPWFMRVVPNDNQQSITLADQIVKEGGGRVGILSADKYDTRYAVQSLSKGIEAKTGKAPLLLEPDFKGLQQPELIERIRSAQLDQLVIPFDAEKMESLIAGLREELPHLRLYGTLHQAMGMERRKSSRDPYEGMYLLGTPFSGTWPPEVPNLRSAYVFDAISLVIDAIGKVGPGREAIREYLSKSVYTGGVTGTISFDEMGNRLNATPLVQIRDGAPRLISNH